MPYHCIPLFSLLICSEFKLSLKSPLELRVTIIVEFAVREVTLIDFRRKFLEDTERCHKGHSDYLLVSTLLANISKNILNNRI